jgi:hypothetical protein
VTKIGKLWTGAVAYVSLLVGAGLSVAGNLADTYRTRGADVDGLDKVMAAGWPILVLLAIEMFVSPRWSSARMFQAWRWIGCLAVGGMAMVVSWTHLHDLMTSRSQLFIVSVVGPLAIDGMAIMATGLILSTRVRGQVATATPDMATDNRIDLTGMIKSVTFTPDTSGHAAADTDASGHDRWADLVAPAADTVDVANLNGMATWAQWSYADDRMVQDLAADVTVTQPLPRRTRTSAGMSCPQEFADMATAWDPIELDRADMVKLSAAYFGTSTRTARRWLAAVLNEPTSGA